MQIDEVVWQIINRQNCSFKVPTVQQTFCRNEYNVTGMCKRSACPLANSQYATVMQDKGVCYLYIKTVERAHMPRDMWEKIKLDKNYEKALEQIDEQLAYWPKFLIHKNKQRLTKLRKMLIRIRKLKLKGYKELVPVKKKAERRDKVREKKAEVAAHVEETIEKELLDRLQTGVYEDLYANLNPKAFNKVLDEQEVGEEQEEEEELDEDQLDSAEYIFNPNAEDDDEDDEEGDDFDYDQEEDFSDEDEQEENSDSEQVNQKRKGKPLETIDESSEDEEEDNQRKNNLKQKPSKKVKTGKKGKKVLNYEYEQEHEQQQKQKYLETDF